MKGGTANFCNLTRDVQQRKILSTFSLSPVPQQRA